MSPAHLQPFGQRVPGATVTQIENALESTGTNITSSGSTKPRINVNSALTALGGGAAKAVMSSAHTRFDAFDFLGDLQLDGRFGGYRATGSTSAPLVQARTTFSARAARRERAR